MITVYFTKKSLNNNLVLVTDEKQEELVLFGTGIGFKKKKGDLIQPESVSKIFQAKRKHEVISIVEQISPQVLSVSEKIIAMGERELNKTLSSSILIAIADHLQCSIERMKAGKALAENALQWEIPFLYYKEYEAGKQALEIIKTELDLELPIIEASFIALHFVNAQDGTATMDDTILITKVTKSIVKSIQSLFNITLNKESIHYSRFVTHIRYFMNRQLSNKGNVSSRDEQLYEIIQNQYQQSYASGLMIREMLRKEYQMEISDDEMVYLIIHIERVVSESR